MRVRVGVASGLRLWFRSSFETIRVSLLEDFVRVDWMDLCFVLVRVCVRAHGKIWGQGYLCSWGCGCGVGMWGG